MKMWNYEIEFDENDADTSSVAIVECINIIDNIKDGVGDEFADEIEHIEELLENLSSKISRKLYKLSDKEIREIREMSIARGNGFLYD